MHWNRTKRSKAPSEASDVIGSILKNKHITEKAKSLNFFLEWEAVVGEHFASISKPEKIHRGLLTIRVLDAVYAQELSMQKTTFIERLSEMGFSGVVSDMKFISGNPRNFK